MNPLTSVYRTTPKDEALDVYVEMGLSLFLLHGITDGRCDCGNVACKHPGKHPLGAVNPHGLTDATNDLDVLRARLAQCPNANIAAATGEAAGFWAVDIDPRSGGDKSFDELEARHGNIPSTLAVATGGDGFHLYWRYPKGVDIRSKAGVIGPGIDQRANGGSIILPPSRHASGKHYDWIWIGSDDEALDIVPSRPALAPIWLVTAALSRPQVDKTLFPKMVPKSHSHRDREQRNHFSGSQDDGGPISSGQRNVELASKAGAMRRAGFTQDEILVALLKLNADRCSPPLEEQEVFTISRSIARYAPGSKPQTGGFRPINIVAGKVA